MFPVGIHYPTPGTAVLGLLTSTQAEAAQPLLRIPGVRLVDLEERGGQGVELHLPRTVWAVPLVYEFVTECLGSLLPHAAKALEVGEDAHAAIRALYDFSVELRDYQKAAVAFIHAYGGVVLADQMGTGKSFTAIAAAILAKREFAGHRPVFIMAPKAVRSSWERELRKVGALSDDADFYALEGRQPMAVRKDGRTNAAAVPGAAGWYFMHYDIVEAWWTWMWQLKPCMVIFDEAHLLSNARTKRAKGAALAASGCRRRVLLTGTPIENRTGEMWNLLQLATGRGSWGGPGEFCTRYAGAIHEGYGLVDQGPTNVDEFRTRLETCYLRRTVEDVNIELAPITRELVEVELTDKQAMQYATLFDGYDPRAIVEGLMAKRMTRDTLTLLGKARKVSSRAKVSATVEEANAAHAQGENVVIFTWERKTAEQIAKKIGHTAVHGGMPQKVREAMLEYFRDNGGTLVATMGALGTGVDGLQDVARVVIMHDLDWTPSTLLQAEARVWRGGQSRAVISKWMICAGTLDEMLARAILKKADIIGSLLGDHEPEQLSSVLGNVGEVEDCMTDYTARWRAWRTR